MYIPIQNLHIPRGLVSVIGSGGKTTFLRFMCERLEGTVILTTSTHIFPFAGIPLITTPADAASCASGSGTGQSHADRQDCAGIEDTLRQALGQHRIVCLGKALPSGKLGSPSGAVPFEDLLSLADYVLVEADGSAGLPLKAHRSFEPVIPSCSSLTVCLAGASGIGKPVSRVCHCPELFAALAGCTPDEAVTPLHVARVLNKENLADFYLVNQVDTLDDPGTALRLCDLISKEACALSLR